MTDNKKQNENPQIEEVKKESAAKSSAKDSVVEESGVKFSDFNFKADLQKAINQAGYDKPTPVQEQSIPIILKGNDLISQAQTGTGKTAAFGLPIIEMMNGEDGVEMLVIVPTRELAMQVADELWKFTRLLNYKTTSVFGGSSYGRQIKFIGGSSIVVATPGRLLDLLEKDAVNIAPKFVVLDEADEMLNMGFITDIRKIFNLISSERQTLMFSATMPDQIKKLAQDILNSPKEVKITPKNMSNDNIEQFFYIVSEDKRKDALVRLLEVNKPEKAIIFCRTKIQTEKVNKFLKGEGFKALALHGDIEQRNRQKIIKEFKMKGAHILVATDVAARGLDIKNVSHVFNFSVPQDTEPYVHRIGRTGRAGAKGEAHTFVASDEIELLKNIQQTVKGNLSASEIPSSKKLQEEEFKKSIDKILKQEITKEGNKLIASLISENGGEEGLLEKVISFMAQPDNSSTANMSLSAKDAQKQVDEFQKGRKGGSGRRSFGGRPRSSGGSRSFGGNRSGGNGGGRKFSGGKPGGQKNHGSKGRPEKNYNWR